MRYVELFEAFSSKKLSGILKYIDNPSKKIILKLLQNISIAIDIPQSFITDDNFMYKSVDSALQVKREMQPIKCGYESVDFPGNFCIDGKVKRKWGKTGERNLTCPHCKGTGLEPRQKGELSYIKFWFNKEGKFLFKSAIDGIKRKPISDLKNMDKTINAKETANMLSDDLGDYIEVSKIPSNVDVFTFFPPNDTILKATLNNKQIIGISFKKRAWHGAHELFILHNDIDSQNNVPYLVKERAYTKGFKYATKLLANDKPIIVKQDSGGSYETPFNIQEGGIELANLPINANLNNASFALILDIKSLNLHKRSDILTKRKSSKEGATGLLDNKTIKKMNMERYINVITNRLNIETQEGVALIPSKIFGGKYSFTSLFLTMNLKRLDNIIITYEKLLKEDKDNKEAIKEHITNINLILSESIKFNNNYSTLITNFLKKTLPIEDADRIIKLLLEIGNNIDKRILKVNPTTIDDYEVIRIKIKGIYNAWMSSTGDPLPTKVLSNVLERLWHSINTKTEWNMTYYMKRFIDEVNANKSNFFDDLERTARITSRF